MTELSVRIGRRLAQARNDLGLKQREVAARMGIDPPLDAQRISDWERGVNKPSERHMQALADALGKDVSWFYEDPDAAPAPDLVGVLSGAPRLDRIEAKLDRLIDLLEAQDQDDVEAELGADDQPAAGTATGSG
jgi:transcriptional regulator with XRE-family HTH domain